MTAALRFPSGGHTLAGTLTVPPGPGPFPAALLLPGSGPVDRNSDHRRMRLGITAQLAGAVTVAGLATLRYDKRGVGDSTGDWRAAGLHDNVDDAAAALATLAARPEVDAARLFLVGHSEGAVLAAALAARGAAVRGVVLLSGSATPGEELLRWQARRIAGTLPAPVRLLLRLLRTDLETQVARNHAAIKRTTTDVARLGVRRINARWHREFLAHDPRADLAALRVPVLAVTGSKDLQTDPADLARIRALVDAPVETHEVPDVTHVLRAQPGPPRLAAYRTQIRQPVDARVLAHVVDWLTRRSR